MKRFFFYILIAGLLLPVSLLKAEFEPPTEGELDQLLANPALINVTIKGANGQEASGVMVRIIERLEEAELVDIQLKYLVAFYTARIVFMLPADEAKAFATELVGAAPPELIPPIMAALSIGGGGIQAFGNFLLELAGDIQDQVDAIENPRIPLTPPVYNVLINALGTSQSLPPVRTDSLPPPIPVGDDTGGGAPPPPVVPPTYDGQG